MSLPRFSWSFVLTLSLFAWGGTSGCGDDDSGVEDAGERPSDVGPDAPRDSGVGCPMSCGSTEGCCPSSEGGNECIDINDDPLNCGGCGVVCAEGRGMACELGLCICGRNRMGCGGDRESFCCPATDERPLPYCANLEQDGEDCGACGEPCDLDVGNACEGGRCICGVERGGCDGTAESRCCTGAFNTSCVDTTSDRDHCGGCDRRCSLGQSCEAGVCVGRDGGPGVDAGVDAGMDSGTGVDAGMDSGTDVDAGTDAGVPPGAGD